MRAYMVSDLEGGNDPPTAIASHLEHFLRVLGEYGGVDMFIYIQTAPTHLYLRLKLADYFVCFFGRLLTPRALSLSQFCADYRLIIPAR
jgi:hypothetical protein